MHCPHQYEVQLAVELQRLVGVVVAQALGGAGRLGRDQSESIVGMPHVGLEIVIERLRADFHAFSHLYLNVPGKKGLLRVSVILRVTAADLIAHCAVGIEVKGFDSLKQVLPLACLLEAFCANLEPDNSILVVGILDTFGRAEQFGAQDLARLHYHTRPATPGLRVVKSNC